MKITGTLKLELPGFNEIKHGTLFVHNDNLYFKCRYGSVDYGANVETGQMHIFLPTAHALPRDGEIVLSGK